jgi:SAM-dependent methyltransferase
MSHDAQWQLEGDAAELYECHVVRHILGPWAVPLLDLADVQPGERVLDVACGTGAVARVAAARVGASGRVTGLDLNAGMLAVARSLPALPGATITWVQRDSADTGLASAAFDLVVCQQGLQFFPDQVAALREMRRVLVPGGRVAISVWCTAGVYSSAVGEALRQHLGIDAASRFLASRAVPTGDDLVRAAIAAGLQDVSLHTQQLTARLPPPEQFVPCHLAATPLASQVKAMSHQALVDMGRSVAQRLAPYLDGEGLAFPEVVHVLCAKA